MNNLTQSTSRSGEITVHTIVLRRLRHIFSCLALLLLLLGGSLFFMSFFITPHSWSLVIGGVGLLTLLSSLLVFLLGTLASNATAQERGQHHISRSLVNTARDEDEPPDDFGDGEEGIEK